MFSSLFGSSKSEKKKVIKKPNINKSIQNIRSAQETLDKRGDHLEKQIAKLTKSAKDKLKKKNKKGALYDIKRKKMLEKELAGIENKKLTLETQTLALENAQMNESVFTAIQDGVTAIEDSNTRVNADEVEDVMDKMQELHEDQDAVNEALGQTVVDFDEDELMKELEDLVEDKAEEEENVSEIREQITNLPDVPSTKIKKKQPMAEEAELAELESMMQ